MSPETPVPTSNAFRILSLDGGGAKGFYTLGILNEIEAMIGRRPLCERFDRLCRKPKDTSASPGPRATEFGLIG